MHSIKNKIKTRVASILKRNQKRIFRPNINAEIRVRNMQG